MHSNIFFPKFFVTLPCFLSKIDYPYHFISRHVIYRTDSIITQTFPEGLTTDPMLIGSLRTGQESVMSLQTTI